MSSGSLEQERLNWLAAIYRAYAADLQRYIHGKVGELALAEDLTSTVFLKALRWLKEDQSEESARGWLYATARTTIADHWQALGQYEIRSLAGLEEQFATEPEHLNTEQRYAEERVQHLLSLLPDRERNVLSLRYLQGYSAAEIAKALGTNAGHIRVLQLRALRRAAQLEGQERSVYVMQGQETPFEEFASFMSAEGRRVFDLALEEAKRLKHNFIGTEHLLWGLASEGSLTPLFAPLGITPNRIHGGIVFIFSRQVQQGQPASPTPPEEASVDEQPDPFKKLTPRTRQAVVLASAEAKGQGERTIRPAHLLLGMLREGSGIGAGLLNSLGVSLLQARAALAPADAGEICSFCGRTGSQVKRIFPAVINVRQSEATPPLALICNQCVERFHEMLNLDAPDAPPQT